MSAGIEEVTLTTIPVGWALKKIGQLADLTAGGTPSTGVAEYWGGDIPWMSSGEVNLGRITNVEGRITEAGFRNSSAKMIPINSVLMALAGQGKTRGKVAFNEIELCTNQSLAAIMPRKGLDYKFLFYNLESRYEEIRGMSSGDGGRGGLNLTIIKSIQLLLPPLPEQQQIAEILSTIDEKMDVIDEQLAQTQTLKKGLMQRLLTKGIGHTTFKDSPLGKIPESWEVRNLEQLVDAKRNIRYGIVQTGENLAKGVPCLRVADFNSRVFKLDSMIRTSPAISAGYPSTVLEANDIVFPLRGRIGEVRLVSEDIAGINLTRGIALISNSDKIEPEYLLWQLLSPIVHKEIMLKVNGTTLQEIPITGLKKVLVPVAPKGEQLQIATILSTVEEKISVLTDKKAQYQELKRGLMQQLLTGQRRVKLRQKDAVLA